MSYLNLIELARLTQPKLLLLELIHFHAVRLQQLLQPVAVETAVGFLDPNKMLRLRKQRQVMRRKIDEGKTD